MVWIAGLIGFILGAAFILAGQVMLKPKAYRINSYYNGREGTD